MPEAQESQKASFCRQRSYFATRILSLLTARAFFSVTQIDLIKSFYNVRLDYDSLMAAHLFAEICDKSTFEIVNLDELLLLTLKSLAMLEKNTYPPKQITVVFMLLALGFHGLRPITDVCAICKKPMESFGVKYYFASDGLTCESCYLLKKTVPASQASLAAVNYILNNSLTGSFHFKVTDEVLAELMEIAFFLWQTHFDFELVSHRM